MKEDHDKGHPSAGAVLSASDSQEPDAAPIINKAAQHPAVQIDQELREELGKCLRWAHVDNVTKEAIFHLDESAVTEVIALIRREREKAVREARIQWEKSALALADYHCKRFS